ncbi:MAG: holo-ACP synthase [Cytophagales bacterium]|nr:holo-ACP synthase [Cytophaga sp.]
MIIGIGVDIVDIERIKQKIEAQSGFKEYVFSSDEMNACDHKSNRYESYAARFAAKEAFLKALGTGIDLSFELHELEVKNNEAGKPYFSYSSTVEDILLTTVGSIPDIQLSLSHSKEQAIAFVVFNKI